MHLPLCQFLHVTRVENAIAHQVAIEGFRRGGCSTYLEGWVSDFAYLAATMDCRSLLVDGISIS